MKTYIYKNGKKLKYGYTTGSCATGAAKAAAWMLLKGDKLQTVQVDTPKGWQLDLSLVDVQLNKDVVVCAVEKDAGDDPDITHGLWVYARVKRSDSQRIYGGQGVGQVTKPGLSVAVGESAINPVPMKMIEDALACVKKDLNYDCHFDVEIFIPRGLEISKKTFNPKLGIVGGISIIGTTGIVEPMSDEAFKESLALELNQLKNEALVFAPGNYGRDFCMAQGVAEKQILKISNFVGYMFEQAVDKGVKKILFVGHIGKLIKVAGGIFQTHSRVSDAKLEILAAHLILRDAPRDFIKEILRCNTTDQAVGLIYDRGFTAVFDDICQSVKDKLQAFVFDQIEVEVILFAMKEGKIGQTDNSQAWMEAFHV